MENTQGVHEILPDLANSRGTSWQGDHGQEL